MSLPHNIDETVANALKEDLGQLDAGGDITASLIAEAKQGTAELSSRENAVLCGTAWFERSFLLLDQEIDISWQNQDGDRIEAGQVLCRLTGKVRSILAGERTGLNFLQTLSATATESARLAERVAGQQIVILDTRKTLPGLRSAQKYAVRLGGCHNHRQGAYDAFLIKENHLMFADSIKQLVELAKRASRDRQLIVEVENLAQLQEVMELPVDVVLLDNFDLESIVKACELVRQHKKGIQLEVSGGVDRLDLAQLASIGIDRVSLGSLTKHCRAIDFSLRFQSP